MKKSMFLPKFSIDSFMMIHYTAEENITEEKLKRLLQIALKLIVNKRLRCLKKMNMLSSKILKEK